MTIDRSKLSRPSALVVGPSDSWRDDDCDLPPAKTFLLDGNFTAEDLEMLAQALRDASSANISHVHAFDEQFGECACGAWEDHFNCPQCGSKTSPSYGGFKYECMGCGKPFEAKDVPHGDAVNGEPSR